VKSGTYPKKNSSDGDSQKKADKNRSVKVRRMEIISYFLGGAAALFLAIAGLHGSPNRSVTIFFVWMAGILTVTAGCCLWLSAEWKKPVNTTVEDRVAIKNPSPIPTPPPNAVVEKPSASSTPKPLPTPSLGPPTFSPKQIMEKIDSEIFSSEKEETKKAFVGVSVDWLLLFSGASRISNKLTVAYFAEPRSAIPLIRISVPTKGNEQLRLVEKNKRFRVRGIIDSIDPLTISLRNATFEPAPE
jgi:hypothetical protein